MRLKDRTNKLIVTFLIGALLLGFSIAFIDAVTLNTCQQPYIFCGVSAQLSFDFELSMLPIYFSKLMISFFALGLTSKILFSIVLFTPFYYLLAKVLKWNDLRIKSRY